MSLLSLKKHNIGEGNPVFLIAEAGVNHNGDINIAHELIDAAKEAGADCVKFQAFTAAETVTLGAPLASHHLANTGSELSHFELIRKLELPPESFTELKYHCEQKNIMFLSTPYDIRSVASLIKLNPEAIKIASSEMTNYPLLDLVRRSQIPVILSTGMAQWNEIVDSVNFIKEINEKICILKCTSNYPASPDSTNLLGIHRLKEAFSQCVIGFSDHSIGNEISLVALGLGVSIIERHFTLDKDAWGPDHRASMNPNEFTNFVKAIRKSEKAFGNKYWPIQDEEKSQRQTMTKGTYAKSSMKQGDIVDLALVIFLRPEGHISPKNFFLNYIGSKIKVDIPAGTELKPEHFIMER
ncbi:N-acetylneuraminate synthase family protein [Candidatus Omnitrophota bacterium]